jgi:undecaprenyl pyrophosphate synthase
MCVNYGGRSELADAARSLARQAARLPTTAEATDLLERLVR